MDIELAEGWYFCFICLLNHPCGTQPHDGNPPEISRPTIPSQSSTRERGMFQLVRGIDETGVSGTGVVAEGVRFTGGKCVMHWLTDISSIAVYDSIDDLVHIHGHGGKTRVEWVDGGA